MKLAILFEYSTLNGGERSMLLVLRHLIAQHALNPDDLHCVVPDGGPLIGRLQKLTTNIHRWKMTSRTDKHRGHVQQLVMLQNELGLDLIHANSLAMGRLSGAYALESGYPATAHVRDIMRLRKSEAALLNGNHRLIAVSDATRLWHVRQGIEERRLCAIHNGVDLSVFQPRPPTHALTEELGIPPNAFVLLNIGQICLRKRQTDAAEAVVTAMDRIPDLHLVLVGERHSQKQESIAFEERIAEIFNDAGRPDRLHPLGLREDIPRLMNEADVLLHTADQEPLGRVLIEAAASGLPIVATDVGGTREIVRHKESAMLVPPRDPPAAANAVVDLYRDDDLGQRLALRARMEVRKQFTVRSSAEAIFREWSRAVAASCT